MWRSKLACSSLQLTIGCSGSPALKSLLMEGPLSSWLAYCLGMPGCAAAAMRASPLHCRTCLLAIMISALVKCRPFCCDCKLMSS